MLVTIFSLIFTSVCHAAQPYPSYAEDGNGKLIEVSSPYLPRDIADDLTAKNIDLLEPSDLFVDEADHVWIVDTGNGRIVRLDQDYKVVSVLGEGLLSDPRGVCVKDDTVYVADAGNARIAVLDFDGKLLREIKKPKSDLIPEEDQFIPEKLIADDRGYLYIACEGNENGLYMLDLQGNFRGFFGANKTEMSLIDILIRMFYTREQRSGKVVKLPFSYVNVGFMNGYVYASTTGASINQIRRLSPSGGDVLFGGESKDFEDASIQSTIKQNFVDFTVDELGHLTVLDQTYGRIYQYDNDGELLFAFGDISVNKGCFLKPSSIAQNSSGELIVLDKERGNFQVLEPTSFVKNIYAASKYYADGDYQKALTYWQAVLEVNSQYTVAQKAIGKIYYRLQDYDKAMYYANSANDKDSYSEAFQKDRDITVGEYFNYIVIAVVLLLIAIVVWKLISRKKRKSLENVHFCRMSLFKRSFHVIFHPYDSFQELKYNKFASYKDMAILLTALLVVRVVSVILTSFLYREAPLEQTNWWNEIAMTFAPYLLLCLGNYSLTTLAEGKATFKEVMVGGAYCLTPIIYLTIPIALLTNILSLSEQGFLTGAIFIMYFMTAFLALVFMQEVQNYGIILSLGILILSVLAAVVIACLVVIAYGLFGQLVDFVTQIFREVVLLAS